MTANKFWVAGTVMLAWVALAATPLWADPPGKDRGDHRAEFMKKFDKNKDGKLDENEREGIRKAMQHHHGHHFQR